MPTVVAPSGGRREARPIARLLAFLAALGAATAGWALADALARAKTSDAFLLPPSLGQLAGYAIALAILAALAVVFEFGAPPLAARGGRAARQIRAMVRRKFRRGRTRAEIANVEVGLTISFCAVLLVAAFIFATAKSILVLVLVLAAFANLYAISSFCRVVGYDLRWSLIVGFLYGLGAGFALT